MAQFHRQVERRIKKKQQEIEELMAERHKLSHRVTQIDTQIQAAKAAVEAFKETLGLAPRTEDEGGAGAELRAGSLPASAYEVLKAHKSPLHINELLAAMGRQPDRSSRTSLASSLSAYVRKGEIFTRLKPNTFGLVEWSTQQGTPEVPAKPWDIEDGVASDDDEEDAQSPLVIQQHRNGGNDAHTAERGVE